MPDIDSQPVPKPRLRWCQFGLRSLFLVMLLACLGMSWIGVKMQRARKQREAVEAILRLGGEVVYDYEVVDGSRGMIQGGPLEQIHGAQPSSPKWLRSLLGDYFFTDVVRVTLHRPRLTDADLQHVKGHLEALTHLQELWLLDTRMTDAGLEHLKGLTQLHWLTVEDGCGDYGGYSTPTPATNEGRKRVQQALPNCNIQL